MESLTVDSLKDNLTFTGDLLIDSSFVLLPKTASVTPQLIKALKNWGYTNLLCDGNLSLGGDIGVDAEDEKAIEKAGKENEKIGENLQKVIENSKKIGTDNSDRSRMEMVSSVYGEYMNYIEQVFTHYTTHKKINLEELSETVKQLVIFIRDHKKYILRINPMDVDSKKNFLVTHTMRTTVLALAISRSKPIQMDLDKSVELGVACILHEIGMLRLPPQLYMTNKKLTSAENAQIRKHTVLGYKILKDLDFPLPIELGVLQHHEKENGRGYPEGKSGSEISADAKIIAVACTYEAISSPRSYKDEKSTFAAIVELIKNEDQAYDPSVLKALLLTVSLYPIGSYVYLSNRKIAQVVDTNQVNPNNPQYPVVQLLTEREKDGSPKTIQTDKENIRILRILNKKEQDDMLEELKSRYKLIEDAQKLASNTPQEPVKKAPPKTIKAKPGDVESEEVDISIFN